MVEVEPGQWVFRRRRNAAFAAAWAAFALGWFACAAVVLITATGDGDPTGVLLGVAVAVPGLLFVRPAVGAWRAGVMITPDEVVVRGPWSAERYPVSEVRRFVAGAQAQPGPNPTPGVVMELADRSTVPVWALAKEGFVWNTERNTSDWRDTAEALSRVLRSARAGTR